MQGPENRDDLRNPSLNPIEDSAEAASRVDPSQGFEITDALPGEDDPDDGYESALAGHEAGESEGESDEAESDAIDELDMRGRVGQGFTSGAESDQAFDAVEEPPLAEGDRVVAAPEDSAGGS